MSANVETELCPACKAYVAHYPIMADEWDCEHDDKEYAFMLAMADAIHGPTPEGEFIDAGWRAAQFLDDAELSWDCGDPPYALRTAYNLDPDWTFLALVNERYLVGIRNEEGAESEFVADIAWVIAERTDVQP